MIGIGEPFTLVDGTSMTVPRYAIWLNGFGWGVENHGVDPDVEVLISPADWAAGRDPQLETADPAGHGAARGPAGRHCRRTPRTGRPGAAAAAAPGPLPPARPGSGAGGMR